ncbi:MAG TPA: universal stress protein [Streptosporangiaceae bacterium]|jgi:nucleotide-binding universal stress UspA family protein|nr:universal stress protein [Streptosporangiaceae bacterium]
MPSAPKLHLVVGYDGSPPAARALDGAVRLLGSRDGEIDVLYVAHVPAVDDLSADALTQVELSFDEIADDLKTQAADQLRGHEDRWKFDWRQGLIPAELIAVAEHTAETHPGDTVVIVVGSSSQAMHRLVGSVAVSLSRRSPVPLVIVP